MLNRPCWVEIATPSLEHNYRLLASQSPVELLAIVKADAYGHGLALCAPAAVRAGARWLGVTSVEEGLNARALCPHAEILALSGPFPPASPPASQAASQGAAAIAHRLTCVVWEPWQLDLLESAALQSAPPAPQSIPVHLELDTGMSRQGVPVHNQDLLPSILQRFTPSSPLRLAGLMTHLYAADENNGHATGRQFALLEQALSLIFAAGHRPGLLHVGNSAALLAGQPLALLQSLCARYALHPMARPGLALYGVAPAFSPAEPAPAAAIHAQLAPVLTWKTRIVSLRNLAPGDCVGYNATFVATQPMRIALLAAGYADGLRRALAHRGAVLVHGCRAPILGRISMDQTVIDVTHIPSASPGDEAVLLGRQGAATLPVEELAALANTIPWEIFTSIAPRVARIQT